MAVDWKKFVHAIEALAPYALAAAGVPAAIIPAVVSGIVLIEQRGAFTSMTGPEKKDYVEDAAKVAIQVTNATTHANLPEDETLDAVSAGVDTAVAVANLIHKRSTTVPQLSQAPSEPATGAVQ